MSRFPDAYEREALDQVTGREGSLAIVFARSGLRYEGRIFSRVLDAERGLEAVVLDTEIGHITLRWAAIEALRTVPEQEPTS